MPWKGDFSKSCLIVDCDDVLVAWHIVEAMTPKIQDIATNAITNLNNLAPGIFVLSPALLPFINVSGDDVFLNPGSIHIGPAWISPDDPNPCPRPTEDIIKNPEHLHTFLEDFAPVTCILHAITCIINPAICIQQRSISFQLRTRWVDGRDTISGVGQQWGLPLPGMQLLQNARISRSETPRGGKCDWLVETHLGSYQGGHVVYPQAAITLPTQPGTITACMSQVWVREVPPVRGNRWIVSLRPDEELTRYLGLRTLAPETIGDLIQGRDAPDDAVERRLVSPMFSIGKNSEAM